MERRIIAGRPLASTKSNCSRASFGCESEPMELRKALIVIGAMLIGAGVFWPWLRRLGLGQLPGDVNFERPGARIYIPLATCLVISALLSLLFWILKK